jgi:hypothetical protein
MGLEERNITFSTYLTEPTHSAILSEIAKWIKNSSFHGKNEVKNLEQYFFILEPRYLGWNGKTHLKLLCFLVSGTVGRPKFGHSDGFEIVLSDLP